MLALRALPRGVRIAFAVAGLITFAACGGGASSGTAPVPNFGLCGNDTQYALARAATAGTSSAEIVASGNNNQVGQSYQSFNLLFTFHNSSTVQAQTGPLALTSDPGGPKPFSSDFYYSATVQSPGLFAGQQYDIYLNAFTSNCTPVGPIGTFFT